MDQYKEFLKIAKCLADELGIIPILYGSLGLARLIGKDLNSKDIDILVPQKYITTEWEQLQKALLKIDYKLADEKEHEFVCGDSKIGIGYEEDLLPFANVEYKELRIEDDNGVKYKTLDLYQYRKVYEASKKDSYRQQNKNKKDSEKIEMIEKYIKSIHGTHKH